MTIFTPLGVMDYLSVSESPDAMSLTAACAAMVADSRHAKVHTSVVPAIVRLREPLGSSCPSGGTGSSLLFSAALRASLTGGYFFRSPLNGEVVKWAVSGSGVEAVDALMSRLRDKDLLPGPNRRPDAHGFADYVELLRVELSGIPHAPHRLAICVQFCDTLRRVELDSLALDVFSGDKCCIELEHVDRLAAIYPSGLGVDPLREKANLAFASVVELLVESGRDVAWSALAVMSEDIVNNLLACGIVQISEEMSLAMLSRATMMPIDSEQVFHLRAAALVAVEGIAVTQRVPSWVVSALLRGEDCGPYKGIQIASVTEAMPCMRVEGTWC